MTNNCPTNFFIHLCLTNYLPVVDYSCNIRNFSALHYALTRQLHKDIILSILRVGADFDLSSRFNTTLNYAITYGDTEIIRIVLNRMDKKTINYVSRYGDSVLHTAISCRNSNVVNLIINQKVYLNLLDKRCQTALQRACLLKCEVPEAMYDARNNTDIIELLLPYHKARNRKMIRNVWGALDIVLHCFNEKNPTHLHIIHLLLFEAHVKIDSELLKLFSYLSKEAVQLMLLKIVKQNHLVYDELTNNFYFYNPAKPKVRPIRIETVNYDNNFLLENYNELKKLSLSEISATHKTTFYQFLCMDKYKIASMLRSQEFHRNLNNYARICLEFPLYSWLILKNYTNGKNLYMENIIFTKCLIRSLPAEKQYKQLDDAISFVIKKLHKYDIYNFTNACRGIKDEDYEEMSM